MITSNFKTISIPNDTFFIADTHFSHKNIVQYCNRPFKDVYEMNEVMIENWNEVVGKKSIVYHLGDFFGPGRYDLDIIEKLNGQIRLIVGSHDQRLVKKNPDCIEILGHKAILSYKKEIITLDHYSPRVWPRSHYNAWSLYGHSHNKLSPIGKAYDVGVDGNNFKPIHISKIEEIMSSQPDNFNLVRRRRY